RLALLRRRPRRCPAPRPRLAEAGRAQRLPCRLDSPLRTKWHQLRRREAARCSPRARKRRIRRGSARAVDARGYQVFRAFSLLCVVGWLCERPARHDILRRSGRHTRIANFAGRLASESTEGSQAISQKITEGRISLCIEFDWR